MSQHGTNKPTLRYVLGYMFSPDRTKVVLIEKDHPEWQAGKLNGVGGKVILDDSGNQKEKYAEAMAREFLEETGVDTLAEDWKHRLVLFGKGNDQRWAVEVFACESEKFDQVRTMESEEVGIFDVREIHDLETIPNLNWMVPMMLDYAIESAQCSCQ